MNLVAGFTNAAIQQCGARAGTTVQTELKCVAPEILPRHPGTTRITD